VVKDLFGRTVASKEIDEIDELLPGNAVTYRTSLSGVPATLRVKATVELEPLTGSGLDDDLPDSVSASTTAWAIPWSLLLVLVLIYAGYRIYRRTRGEDDDEESPPPSAPTDERVPEPIGG
jgi:hypothetical protein